MIPRRARRGGAAVIGECASCGAVALLAQSGDEEALNAGRLMIGAPRACVPRVPRAELLRPSRRLEQRAFGGVLRVPAVAER